MDIATLNQYFIQYGAIFVFVIVFLEYLNLPGFPAGIIMPLAGIWASKGEISCFMTMVLSVSAGLLGSWILYFLGRFGGDVFLKAFGKKFPKQQELVLKNMEVLRQKGCIGVFISKLLPMVRTIISIPAGAIKMDFIKYSISSVLGIFIWNFVFIGAGYVFGEAVFEMFG